MQEEEKRGDFIHGLFKYIIEYSFGVSRENQNEIKNLEFYLDKLDLHNVHPLISKSIRDIFPQDALGTQRNRKAKLKIINPKWPQTQSPEQRGSSLI
jgi:hypothetical protein